MIDIRTGIPEFLWTHIAPKHVKDHTYMRELFNAMHEFAYTGKADEFKEAKYNWVVTEGDLYHKLQTQPLTSFGVAEQTLNISDLDTFYLEGEARSTDPFAHLMQNIYEGRIEAANNYMLQADNRVRANFELFQLYVDTKEEQYVMEFLKRQIGGFNDGWYNTPEVVNTILFNDVKARAEMYFKMKQKTIEQYDIFKDDLPANTPSQVIIQHMFNRLAEKKVANG